MLKKKRRQTRVTTLDSWEEEEKKKKKKKIREIKGRGYTSSDTLFYSYCVRIAYDSIENDAGGEQES
jgi:hypothetical protein